jgi:uncharacterized protein YggE
MKLTSEAKIAVKTSILSAIFTVLLFMLVNYFFNHSWNLFPASANSPLFTVTGTGILNEKPDQADISFTVTQTDLSLQVAQTKANKQANTIVSDLVKIGIAQKDIQTSNYSSDPNTQDGYGGPAQIIFPRVSPSPASGYTVSEDIDVSVHDVTKAGRVIDVVTKDGAEDISGPSLSFSDSTQQSLTDQARIKAILNAKQKAQSMADAAGVHLGRIVNIQDNNSPYPIMPMAAGGMLKSNASSVPTSINTGQNTINASVTLSYETW